MADSDVQKELTALKKEMAKLQADLRTLTEDSGKAAKQATDTAKEATAAALEKLEAEAQKLMDNLQRASASAVKTGEDTIAGVQENIQERPLVSAAAALGIGFVLGMLITRRG